MQMKGKKKLLVWILVVAMLVSNIIPNETSAKAKKSAKRQTTFSAQEDNLEVSGTNSFGKLIAELLDGEIESRNDYYISDLEIIEKQAKVKYSVSQGCSLVVAVYDEQGIQMLGSGMKSITSSKSEITVDIDVEDLPQYFLVKAFLLDSEKNTALSQAYTCDHYTQEFQDFLCKTTDDFEQDKILNLDEDATTNFAVFNNETTHIEGKTDKNRMVSADMENNKYVIADANSKTKALRVGEIFYYTNDVYDIMVKIKTIHIDGDTVTITAEEAKLDEIFSYIKIEADTSEAEITMDNSALGEGVTYIGSQTDEPDFSSNRNFSAKKKAAVDGNVHYSKDWHLYELDPKIAQSAGNVSASISGKIRLAVSYRGDIDVYLDSNRFEIDFTIKPAITLNLSVKGSIDLNVPLGKGVAISPMPGVYITFDPRFKASLSAEMSANIKGEFALGMGYDTNQGLVNKSQEPTLTADYDMNAAVYIGLSLEPRAKILSDYLASAWLKIDAGAKVEVSASDSTKKDNKKQHDCTNCLEGSIHFLGSLSAGADVNLFFKEFHPSVVLWKPDFKVADFYYSATYNEGGLTTCPHIRYLTTVNVVDKLGRDFSGIKVYWDNGEQSITNKSGDAKAYLANGTHTALVKNPNNANDTKTKEFEVKGKSSTVQLKADWSRGNFVNIKVVDIHENAAQNVTVYCSAYTDGNATDEDGMAYFTAQNGTYDFYIVDADGNRITKSATLNGTDENLTLQATWNCSHLVTLNIQDKNGIAVAGAKVTYGDKKVTADGNGKAEIWVANGKHTFYVRDAEENMVLPTVKEVTVKDANVSETVTLGDDIENTFDKSEQGSIVDGGKCGDGVRWQLYDGGLLYIYGQGKITQRGWSGYRTRIIKVIISNGVQNVIGSSFENCGNLKSVTIPESVAKIGSWAFCGCDNLASVTIPESVARIEMCVFRGCDSLASVTIPEGVTSIEEYAFDGCSDLSSVTILGSVTSIGRSAFNGCNSLGSIMIPRSVTSIGESAFKGCSGLRSITISEGVTNIGGYAFDGCSSLRSVTIPGSVTSIGESAFDGCSGLRSITISEGVTNIGGYAFHGCSSLRSATIPGSVTNIGRSAFYGCSNLGSVTMPGSVTSIESGAFWHCSSLTSITIPGSVTSIGSSAFSGCSSLRSVTIPGSVTSIGSNAFSGCSSLRSVTIPGSVTSIGNNVFEDCSGLTSVTIPGSVTSIGNNVFEDCSGLTSITISEGVTSIGEGAFIKCSGLTSITIPGSVTSIGESAFNDCSSLRSVTISEGVTSIGQTAFKDCSGLTSVMIPGSVTSIESGAFIRCSGLRSVTISEGVTNIGGYAFDSCSSLTSVTIPGSVTNIGEEAFWYCSSLTSVTIPGSVTNIGDRAFFGCSSLTSVTILGSATNIGNSAFLRENGKIIIYAPTGSYAETYAKEANITFVPLSLSKKSKVHNKKGLIDNAKFVEKKDAVSKQNYILLVLKNPNAESMLSADNLLYIDQAVADDNGTVSYSYLLKEETDDTEVMILGPENYDLSALEKVLINCENGLYTKESQEFAKEDLRTALRLALKWTFAESQKEIDILARRLNDFLDEVGEESTSSPTPDVGDSDATSSPSPGNTALPEPDGTASQNPTNAPIQSTKPVETLIPTPTATIRPNVTVAPDSTATSNVTPTVKPSAEPVVTSEPSVSPTNTPVPSAELDNDPAKEHDSNANSTKNVRKGSKVTDKKTKAVYKITGTGKNRTVEYIKSTKKNAVNIIIPAKVTLNGKRYKITSIGEIAFRNSKKLKTVKIGANVKIIGKQAFSGCKKLTNVTMGKRITTIRANAFSKCTALTMIIIPTKVQKIGKEAFCQCKNLRYIHIKTKKLTLSSIGKNAFGGGYASPRVKTDKGIWKKYSNIFVQRGMSKKAVFIIAPVKLIV